MKRKKTIIAGISILLLVTWNHYAQRRAPLPMSELTNPKSPSYVPIPYPTCDEEIILNLNHYIEKRLKSMQKGFIKRIDSKEAISETRAFREYLNGKIMIGEIAKVYNDLDMWEKECNYLIRLKDNRNLFVCSFFMEANGLISSRTSPQAAFFDPNFGESDIYLEDLKLSLKRKELYSFFPYNNREAIANQLRIVIGKTLSDKEVNSMKLVDGNSAISSRLFPSWRIELSNGDVYYYSFRQNGIYKKVVALNKELYKNKSLVTEYLHKGYQNFELSAKGQTEFCKEIWNKFRRDQ